MRDGFYLLLFYISVLHTFSLILFYFQFLFLCYKRKICSSKKLEENCLEDKAPLLGPPLTTSMFANTLGVMVCFEGTLPKL